MHRRESKHQRVRDRWATRRLRMDRADGNLFIEFSFPTEEGPLGRLCVPNSDLRHRERILDKFADLGARYPRKVDASDDSRMAFLRTLNDQTRGRSEIVPTRTGFFGEDQFCTHAEIVDRDDSRRPLPKLSGQDHDFVDVKGVPRQDLRDKLS